MNFTELEQTLLVAMAVLVYFTFRSMAQTKEMYNAAAILHRVLSDVADGKAKAYRDKDGALTATSINSPEKT
jgi:hypothetical protein